MTRWMTGVAALALAISMAGPAAARHKKPPNCPVCKMALSKTKTDANPTAVKIKKTTYYCCDKCDMSQLGKKPATPAK
jgi:hypothetical protein